MRSFLRTGKKGIIGALQGALFIRFLYLYMFREGSSRSCRSCSWRFIIDLDEITVVEFQADQILSPVLILEFKYINTRNN